MISIARELDAHDIAQELRQERQVHKGSFLLLEGDRDIKRFTKFVDENACSIQNCFGRENLLGAIEILIDEGFPGVLALADAAFDRIDGCLHAAKQSYFPSLMILVWTSLRQTSCEDILLRWDTKTNAMSTEAMKGSELGFLMRASLYQCFYT